MTRIGPISRAALVFAACGLVGPAIRIALWPPSADVASSDFTYWLVRLLWITQGWGSSEGVWNSEAMWLVAENVVLYGLLGAVAGAFIRRPIVYLGVGACLLAELATQTGLAVGFSTGSAWLAFLGASGVYAVPFGVVWHLRDARKFRKSGEAAEQGDEADEAR